MMTIDFNSLKINKLNPTTDFEKKIIFFLEEWFSQSKTVKVKTSGSTGTPKILDIDKDKMRYSAQMTLDFLKLTLNDTALLCLPIEYISGKMMIVRAIEKQLKLSISTPTIHPLNTLNKKIDFCAMTPLQVENSLDKIHWIKKLIIGGAATSESLKRKIHTVLNQEKTHPNYEIYETYGMSETLSHIALKEIYPNKKDYFKILNRVQISQDERGCLMIDAPKIHPEKLITNDIVEIKNDNEFKFLGRADNVINSGGAKIFPEELEFLVKKQLPNEVVFIGVPDETLGQRLTLVIEGKESAEIHQIINNIHFEKKFHHPKSILFINKIPRTENGKVNRIALRTNLKNIK